MKWGGLISCCNYYFDAKFNFALETILRKVHKLIENMSSVKIDQSFLQNGYHFLIDSNKIVYDCLSSLEKNKIITLKVSI